MGQGQKGHCTEIFCYPSDMYPSSCQQETESTSDISEAVDEDTPIDDTDSTRSSDDEPDVISVEEGDITNASVVDPTPDETPQESEEDESEEDESEEDESEGEIQPEPDFEVIAPDDHQFYQTAGV